ncbi:MAG: aspartate 1-decarboxylase [Bacillota bacterium]|nr:aspartate 1-decarboxylase [Bacillota bacterium]
MFIKKLKSKIHRATVTEAELDYVGSITIDKELLQAANIQEYEQVQIVNINNGNRFITYTIAGKKGSGIMCLNGAAARCVSVGDKIIVMSYASMDESEGESFQPQVVLVDEKNRIQSVNHYEHHGKLEMK